MRTLIWLCLTGCTVAAADAGTATQGVSRERCDTTVPGDTYVRLDVPEGAVAVALRCDDKGRCETTDFVIEPDGVWRVDCPDFEEYAEVRWIAVL